MVFAHIGGGGMARKKPDLFGAYCCSACHDVLDGRVKSSLTKDDKKLAHYEGVERTQEILLAEGLILIA